MASSSAVEDGDDAHAPASNTCPPWCVTAHGMHQGEEDWIHTSEPVPVAEGLLARVAMSIDPDTGAEDGPYILIGTDEYTLNEAKALGGSLIALADAAGDNPQSSVRSLKALFRSFTRSFRSTAET